MFVHRPHASVSSRTDIFPRKAINVCSSPSPSFSAIFARTTLWRLAIRTAAQRMKPFPRDLFGLRVWLSVIQFTHGVSCARVNTYYAPSKCIFQRSRRPRSVWCTPSVQSRPIIRNDAYRRDQSANKEGERIILRPSSYSCKHCELSAMPSRITDVRAAYQFFTMHSTWYLTFRRHASPASRWKVHKLNNWIEIMDGFKSNRGTNFIRTRVTFRVYLLKDRAVLID